MGATSARKARTILAHTERVIAVEAMTAAQGLDLRAPLQPSRATGAARAAVRKLSPYLDEDRSLSEEISALAELVKQGQIQEAVASEGVELT